MYDGQAGQRGDGEVLSKGGGEPLGEVWAFERYVVGVKDLKA